MTEEFPEEQSYFMEENSPGPAGRYLLGKIRVLKHRPQEAVTSQTSEGCSVGTTHTKDARTDFGLVSPFSHELTACSTHVTFTNGHIHATIVSKCDVKSTEAYIKRMIFPEIYF